MSTAAVLCAVVFVHSVFGFVLFSAESLPSPGDHPGRGGWRHCADCGRPGQQWVGKCQDCRSEWMCSDQLTYVCVYIDICLLGFVML